MIIRHLRWDMFNLGRTTNGQIRARLERRWDHKMWLLLDNDRNQISEHHSTEVLKKRAEHLFETGYLKLTVKEHEHDF